MIPKVYDEYRKDEAGGRLNNENHSLNRLVRLWIRICRPGMTQEQATILITEAFWALKERPNIDVQRVTYEGGAIDQRALGVNRAGRYLNAGRLSTPGISVKVHGASARNYGGYPLINDFRLYREITDGKSITCMIAGLNKEYGDVVESGLLFC